MFQRSRIFSDDYFVVTKRRRRLREWSWEIQRRSKPLGVKLNGDGFKSEFAAKLAGEKALRKLLDGLAQEGKVLLSQKAARPPCAIGRLIIIQTLPTKPAVCTNYCIA